jgi:hypothetical protein
LKLLIIYQRFCTFVTEGLDIPDEEYEKFEENPFEYTRSEEHDEDVEENAEESEPNRYSERF